MTPYWRFIFLEWMDLGSPVDSTCPECGQHLTVGIHIIEGVSATYYSRCWGCGFDLKIARELDMDGFDYDTFMDTI